MKRDETARPDTAPSNGIRDGLLTLDEAAAYLQIAPGTLKHWALAKKVEYVKLSKFMCFTRPALDRYIESQTVKAEDSR